MKAKILLISFWPLVLACTTSTTTTGISSLASSYFSSSRWSRRSTFRTTSRSSTKVVVQRILELREREPLSPSRLLLGYQNDYYRTTTRTIGVFEWLQSYDNTHTVQVVLEDPVGQPSPYSNQYPPDTKSIVLIASSLILLRGGGIQDSLPTNLNFNTKKTTDYNYIPASSSFRRVPPSSSQRGSKHSYARRDRYSSFSSTPSSTNDDSLDESADVIDDDESDLAVKDMIDSFLTRDSRNSFIARVYAILSVQLLVTAISVCFFGLYPSWSTRTSSSAIIPIGSLLLSTIAWMILCFNVSARRQSPLKWQLLTLFTLGEAISVGYISSFYKFQSVLWAMISTCIATISVSIYTIQQRNPQYDLSQWGASLSSIGLIFVSYGFIHILQLLGILPLHFLPYNDLLYGLGGACLFSLYLAHHTRLIVAGKHSKYQMNDKDYVFGAVALYNDVINIFLYILRIIGEDKDERRKRKE